MKRKALGKGINALIPDFETGVEEDEAETGLKEIPLEDISTSRLQPRKKIDDQALVELADSIRENGVVQPIIVQKGENNFELICGERRWRAAKKAGLKKIPAVVREVTSDKHLQMALIENIHRQDLNPMEEATAYQQLIDEFGFTQDVVARRVGKSRASVANTLRLLNLSRAVQDDLINGRMSMGHARALLGLASEKSIEELRKEIVGKGLSVRETESRVAKSASEGRQPKASPKKKKDIFVADLEKEMGRALGTKVEIKTSGKGGKLIISYYSNDDLSRIHDMIQKVKP